jgi:hypothetical protein
VGQLWVSIYPPNGSILGYQNQEVQKHPDQDEKLYENMLRTLEDSAVRVSSGMIEDCSNLIQKGLKICSFSTTNSSIIMWNHYADNHTGFCMEYDLTKLACKDIRLRFLYPVIYSRNLFDATPFLMESIESGSINVLLASIAALYKSTKWSYENEWRIVFALGVSQQPFNYSMPTPSALYLGSRMIDVNKKELIEIGRQKGVAIYESHLSRTEFELYFEKIEHNQSVQ